MKKSALFLFISSLFSITTFAGDLAPNITVTCKSIVKAAEIAGFTVQVKDKSVGFVGNYGNDSLRASTEKEPNTEKLSVRASDIQDRGEGLEILNLKTSFDFGDFASVTVELLYDDNGLAGVLDFNSDGPHTVSFYRCTVTK